MKDATGQIHQEKGDTWPKILRYNYETYGDQLKAMRHKHYGIWQPYTWKDYYLRVKFLALGLLSLGFEAGDKVLIIGDNAPEWYYAELAAQANHGISVGAYSDLTPDEIRYFAENSEAGFVIVEGQEEVDKVLQVRSQLPLLKKVIYWNYKGLAHYSDPILMGYRDVLQLGEKYEREHAGRFEHNVDSGKTDDVCAIVYTSGTTGAAPKGAVHTYRTMKAGADFHLVLDPWDKNDRMVPYLPPAGMTEQWLGVGCHLLSACTLNFSEKPETLQRDMREIRPTIVFCGARLWESQAGMIQARILGSHTVKRLAFRLLLPIGRKVADGRYQKKKTVLHWALLHLLGDWALFRPVKRSLGLSRARICYATGAILSPDAARFYHALHLPLKSLYSTTEGGTLTGSKNGEIRSDTVGPVHDQATVNVTEEGELIYRQAGMFLGYFKDPAKTAEALKDGWFHSGDNVFVREDGQMVFVDRVNDLIRLTGGDTLAPQLVESRLRFSPYIKDAWVFAGPQRSYASAIIAIHYHNVGRWAGQRKVAYSNFAELSQKPEVCELVKQSIIRINETLPAGARVKKYVNLHKEFDADEGDLTRTRKLKRRFLEGRYREIIEALYGEKTEVPVEVPVKSRDGRTVTVRTVLRIQNV
jgi:long-chain acyl-CoA synthetase